MASVVHDRQRYEAFLTAYRESPQRHSKVARKVGCDMRTAVTIWEHGWKDKAWARPIKEVLANEAKVARAKEVDERTRQQVMRDEAVAAVAADPATTKKVAEQATAAIVEEAKLTRMGRTNATVLLGVAGQLLPGAYKLAERVGKELEASKAKPGESVRLLNGVASLARTSVEVAKCVLEIERMRLGDPLEALGLAGKPARDPATITPQEALAELEAAQAAVARMGGLIVLPGGKGHDAAPVPSTSPAVPDEEPEPTEPDDYDPDDEAHAVTRESLSPGAAVGVAGWTSTKPPPGAPAAQESTPANGNGSAAGHGNGAQRRAT